MVYVIFQVLAERVNAECFCVFPAICRGDAFLLVEGVDGLDDAFGGLFLKEAAGFAVFDGFEGAASAVGDDGCAAGLGFDWGDAEVFFGGEDEGFGVLHLILEDFEGLVAHHRDVGFGDGLGLLEVGAVADDDELSVGHLVEGFDDQLDFLVGHHA